MSEGPKCQGEFTVFSSLKLDEPLEIFEYDINYINGMDWKGKDALERLIMETLGILDKKKSILLIEFESCKWHHYERDIMKVFGWK